MVFFSVKQSSVNTIQKCVKPVVSQPVFFIILFLLLKATDVFSYVTAHSFPIYSIAGGVVICYILSVPVIFLRKSARIFYKIVLMASFCILFLVDVFLLLLYNMTFNTCLKILLLLFWQQILQRLPNFWYHICQWKKLLLSCRLQWPL